MDERVIPAGFDRGVGGMQWFPRWPDDDELDAKELVENDKAVTEGDEQ